MVAETIGCIIKCDMLMMSHYVRSYLICFPLPLFCVKCHVWYTRVFCYRPSSSAKETMAWVADEFMTGRVVREVVRAEEMEEEEEEEDDEDEPSHTKLSPVRSGLTKRSDSTKSQQVKYSIGAHPS